MIGIIERALVKRPPRQIAGSYFSVSMSMIAFGYVSGYPVRLILVGVLLPAGVALITLGLRYIEQHCPPPH